jgi:hypothetical protein
MFSLANDELKAAYAAKSDRIRGCVDPGEFGGMNCEDYEVPGIGGVPTGKSMEEFSPPSKPGTGPSGSKPKGPE